MNKRGVVKMLASRVLQICKASHVKIQSPVCVATLIAAVWNWPFLVGPSGVLPHTVFRVDSQFYLHENLLIARDEGDNVFQQEFHKVKPWAWQVMGAVLTPIKKN
jgi:hypothetical protein